MSSVVAVDLFCGVGGLTYGLAKAGISVAAGVDIDPDCEYAYEANNDAVYINKGVEQLQARHISKYYNNRDLSLLAGCAPCQPFSKYSQGSKGVDDDKWTLLYEFDRLVKSVKPDLITMENVPQLVDYYVFDDFVRALKRRGYFVYYDVVDCKKYGLPQMRKRLVLLASALGEIELIAPTHTPAKYRTVKDAIGKLPSVKAGVAHKSDPLHITNSLSDLNLKRIKQSKPGGTWKDWDRRLRADCHKKASGKTYASVYGRMEWNKPSPTITTQFYGFGNGRFGHPRQDRALTLREGAIIQGFPKKYKFVRPGEKVKVSSVGRLIGNAVPVRLGEIIGRSIMKHVDQYC